MFKTPVIAVTPNVEEEFVQLKRSYTEAVADAGGLPLIVPPTDDASRIARICELADGLLLTGGNDVSPALYGEEPQPGLGSISPDRDRLETALARAFLTADKPVFAICRGHQLLNAAAGGTLYQDIVRQYPDPLLHRQDAPRHHLFHHVTAAADSRLAGLAGTPSFRVNSFHHQAVKEVAPGFRAVAWAADGMIEAIESDSYRFAVGVQWHPEDTARTDAVSQRLFAGFIQACGS